ncbi:MAG: HEPN domain-containing protein [Deltaproteobacteria bacterium]|nr:HEPN domain-containing protein [Deltaproteobacteria bacterium]
MNKTDLQKISEIRLNEAKNLLDNGFFDGAYYLLGYAIECAFKACIAKQFKEYDFPDKKLVNKSHTHELEKLLGLAGLKQKLQEAQKENEELELNWAVVKDWSAEDRYQHGITEQKAKQFYEAVTQENIGIYSWLKNWW